MPFDLQGLKSRERPISVKPAWAPDEPINATYRPRTLTSELFDELVTQAADPKMLPLANLLEKILVSWDVTSDGKPTKPTSQILMQLDPQLLQGFSREILSDMRGTPTPANDSPGT